MILFVTINHVCYTIPALSLLYYNLSFIHLFIALSINHYLLYCQSIFIFYLLILMPIPITILSQQNLTRSFTFYNLLSQNIPSNILHIFFKSFSPFFMKKQINFIISPILSCFLFQLTKLQPDNIFSISISNIIQNHLINNIKLFIIILLKFDMILIFIFFC